jgi:antitoxin (DNA-binding transcriptional repressor) of toxin-antitoxin stability system
VSANLLPGHWRRVAGRLSSPVYDASGLGQTVDKVAPGGYQPLMRSVGLKVLKNKLSEYVRLAAGGETVLVTDRDRVVAEIVPPQPGRSALLMDALLAEAVREGWLTPPVLAGSGPPPRKPVMALHDLMQDLQRDREDR